MYASVRYTPRKTYRGESVSLSLSSHTHTHTHTHPVEYNMLQENIISCVTGWSPRSNFYPLQSSLYAYLISESTERVGIKFRFKVLR